VPILDVLRGQLDASALATGLGLVFGRGVDEPFGPKGIADRARRVWEAVNEREREAAESGKGAIPSFYGRSLFTSAATPSRLC
jgi:hypothetical protein